MKKLFLFVFCCLLGTAFAADFSDDTNREAVRGVFEQVEGALRKHPFGNSTVAILPFPGDDNGFLAGCLKNALTRSGVSCIEGKEDPMFNEIIKEIAWDERKDDILDSSTMVKFGKLKAAQILVYGKLLTLNRNAERVFVEIELHATNLATKQHIWGGNFAYRFYFGKDVHGIVELDENMKNLLLEKVAELGKMLKEPSAAAKLNGIETIAVIPFAGDIDRYITNLTISMLTKGKYMPKDMQISLSLARMLGRSGQLGCDAIFHGAVRDLRISAPKTVVTDKGVTTQVTVFIDLQCSLEDAKSGNILWADQVIKSQVVSTERAFTAEEKRQMEDEKIQNIPHEIKKEFAGNWKTYLVTAVCIAGGIILLLLVIFVVKLFLSYNNVR